MTKKTGIALLLAGVLLILSAIGVQGYFSYEDSSAGREAEKIMSELHSAVDEQSNGLSDKKSKPKTKTINGYSCLGYLSIEPLGLELPVLSDWDYSRLKLAPCRYSGLPSSNDFVIAGHNYRSHFGRLSLLKIGEEISFTDVNGKKYNYVIEDIELLQPTDVEQMTDSAWDLTLYTCTTGATERLTIRCRRI